MSTAAARKHLQRERESEGQRWIQLITDDDDEDALIAAGLLTEAQLDHGRKAAAAAVSAAIKRLLFMLRHA